MIAPGYMPSFNKDGKISIVICSIEGYKSIDVLSSQTPNDETTEHQTNISNDTCPFSLHSHIDTFANITPFFDDIVTERVSFQNIYAYITYSKKVTADGQRAPPVFIL